jgi:hypothetical protein
MSPKFGTFWTDLWTSRIFPHGSMYDPYNDMALTWHDDVEVTW